MQYKSVKGYTPLAQLGILLLFLAGGFILAAIVQLIIGFQMMPPGVPAEQMSDVLMKAMLDPKNVGLARLSQVLGTFFLLFVPVVFYSWITYGKNKFWLGLNNYLNAYQIIIGFFIILAATFFAAPIGDLTKDIISHYPSLDNWAKQLETMYNEQVLAMSNLRSWPEFFMAIVIMGFFPALFEEVFFRAGLQNILIRWFRIPVLGIIVTSVLFSLVHMSVYLFFSRLILGFVLGLMYQQSKNIWVNVIAHFLNNTIAVAQLFWMSTHAKKIDLDKLDPKINWTAGIIAFAILIFLFWLFNKYSLNNRLKVEAKEALLYAQGNTHDPFHKTDDNGAA